MAEIERKWLLENLPPRINTNNSLISEISQGYVLDGDIELRIRKEISNVAHRLLTIKGSGDLSREEWPESGGIEIPEWVFDGLWQNIKSSLIKKRYTTPIWDGVLEFDVYQGKLSGLVIVECEFDSKEEADNFTLPDWVGLSVEATKDPRFKNKNLANLTSQDLSASEIMKLLKG